MGLFSRLKKACKVPEPQPCVLLKHTTITAENHMHPHPLDEISGGAHEIVDRKNEAGRRERKNKRFWRSFLIFFFAEELENTTWLSLRKCTKVRRDRIRDLPMVKSHMMLEIFNSFIRETFIVLAYSFFITKNQQQKNHWARKKKRKRY